ncbi:hypothetical protein DAEQUDRAFT_801836 [Daedalea quercina L-15889]|uniref:Uncharacterized protein n=1 Tax=Daedalea quercina L-15889 TaxID=1314783 RepID=A0A165M678_9APHY|nr:hypothetical protein DAEQUDRAFT_801836 [Daedalea quercina L-15889]
MPSRARGVPHRRLISRTTERRNDEPPKAAGKESRLPLLQRPLGVSERPTSLPQSWEQKREELLDQEKRLKKRHELVREATKGYFTDLNATRRYGGKMWIAPKTMIREDKALYFPDIVGTNLRSKGGVHTTSLCTGKVSIIAMLTTRISELQVANYITPTHEQYSSHPMYRYIQVNLQENLLKSLLVSLFTSNIRKTVPEELWDTYLVSSQNMDYVRHDMGLDNSRIGYVYLVDEQCRIRWAACADPIVEEIEALRVCTGVLLKRHTKGSDNAPS